MALAIPVESDLIVKVTSKEGLLVHVTEDLLTIRCKRSHTFKMTVVSLIRGTWCSECKKYDLAKTFGHKYLGGNVVICSGGHRYVATETALKNELVCKVCPMFVGRFKPKQLKYKRS